MIRPRSKLCSEHAEESPLWLGRNSLNTRRFGPCVFTTDGETKHPCRNIHAVGPTACGEPLDARSGPATRASSQTKQSAPPAVSASAEGPTRVALRPRTSGENVEVATRNGRRRASNPSPVERPRWQLIRPCESSSEQGAALSTNAMGNLKRRYLRNVYSFPSQLLFFAQA